MKNHSSWLFAMLFGLSFMFASCFESKEVIRQTQCDATIQKKIADSVANVFAKDGFTVLQATQVSVKNDFEQPIMFPLQQGGHYQLIFAGDPNAKKWELRLSYMDSGGAVDVKKHLTQDGPLITKYNRPTITTRYVAHLYQRQINGPETLCGYFILMKKTQASTK